MITENLSTLKIHKLSQEQYDREHEAGRLDEYAIYLTPGDGSGSVGSSTQSDWEQTDSMAADYIKNKPFYSNVETATCTVSDPSTMVTATSEVANFIKIFDLTPTEEELLNSTKIKITVPDAGIERESKENFIEYSSNDIIIAITEFEIPLLIVYKPGSTTATVDGQPFTVNAPETGMYIMDIQTTFTIEIEINKVKTLDIKYLPKNIEYGYEEKVFNDIVWDGNTNGLLEVIKEVEAGDGAVLQVQGYKVSDEVISKSDIDGAIFGAMYIDSTEEETDNISQDKLIDVNSNGSFVHESVLFACITQNNTTADLSAIEPGITIDIPESGIWFIKLVTNGVMMASAISLTTIKTNIKQIDSKFIKDKIGNIQLTTVEDVYDLENCDDGGGDGDLCMAMYYKCDTPTVNTVNISLKHKITGDIIDVGICEMYVADYDGAKFIQGEINTTTKAIDLINEEVDTIIKINESLPAVTFLFFEEEQATVFGVNSTNCLEYELIVSYEANLPIGLPDVILGEEFKNVNGKLTSMFGKTLMIEHEIKNSHTTTLESPATTSPFVIWQNISILSDNIQENTPITVSYYVGENLVEIENVTPFTNETLDAQFNVSSECTGYWCLVNANQSIIEILTQGVWTRVDSNKPTIVICLAKHNTEGRSSLTIAAPELLTGTTFKLDITTKEIKEKVIKLPSEAIEAVDKVSDKEDGPVSSSAVYRTYNNLSSSLQNKAPLTHNHSASDINSGTLSELHLPILSVSTGGTGYSSITDTTYTTIRYRASSLHSSETNPTVNGSIAWVYE